MHDELVSQAKVIAYLLWGKSLGLLISVWIAAGCGMAANWHRALICTTIFVSAIASVWQCRIYAMRVAALIRVGSGLQSPDAEVHAFGRGNGVERSR